MFTAFNLSGCRRSGNDGTGIFYHGFAIRASDSFRIWKPFAATNDYKDSGVTVKGGKAEKVTVAQMFKPGGNKPSAFGDFSRRCVQSINDLADCCNVPLFFISMLSKSPDIIPTFFGLTSILMLIGSTLVPFITKNAD